ncbi:hypothetical protein TNCT_415951 [Trichonephila clavata]|uniref:Uncharacterized protein n=1 Tax=Trichonephila clavata TaxID=2740835 RepID=A0A8X6GCW2_TRICU|nr:hypothetical protein TNCT_415951 [Trichonephila clavata]
MTSIDNGNWSDRSDAPSEPSTTGLGASSDSPSRKTFGDDFIVENSDIYREAIRARNVYAAWARKLTQAKTNDQDLQNYHQELGKSGEMVVEPAAKNQEEKTLPVAPSTPPPSPRSVKKKREKRRADEQGFIPPGSLCGKSAPLLLSPPPPLRLQLKAKCLRALLLSISTTPAAEGEGMEIVSDDPPTGTRLRTRRCLRRKRALPSPPPFSLIQMETGDSSLPSLRCTRPRSSLK